MPCKPQTVDTMSAVELADSDPLPVCASRVLVRSPSSQSYSEDGPTVTFRSMAGRHTLH